MGDTPQSHSSEGVFLPSTRLSSQIKQNPHTWIYMPLHLIHVKWRNLYSSNLLSLHLDLYNQDLHFHCHFQELPVWEPYDGKITLVEKRAYFHPFIIASSPSDAMLLRMLQGVLFHQRKRFEGRVGQRHFTFQHHQLTPLSISPIP